MGFRDDELAGRERIEALERELRALREENETLRSEEPKARPPSKLGGFALIVFLLALVAIGMAVLAGWSIPTHGDDLGIALSLVAGMLLMIAALLAVLARLLIIVPPGKVVVLSGRNRNAPDGSTVGWRVVRAGRVLKLPILERSDEMDVTPIHVDSWIRNAYSRGNHVVEVHFRALVRIGSHEPLIRNAIERFLGQDRDHVARVARETLEGAVRGVVAQLTIEQLREDGLAVAAELIREAEDDFQRLGLDLETLHLLEVETR